MREFLVARSVPPIHDISTDLANPPGFPALADVRRLSGANPLERTKAVTAAQLAGYPGLVGLTLDVPAAQAFDRALKAVKTEGWSVAVAEPDQGHIEATATTALFGFRDDVSIRVERIGPKRSRIDMRSVSRQGVSDLGTNAARIRRFLHLLQN